MNALRPLCWLLFVSLWCCLVESAAQADEDACKASFIRWMVVQQVHFADRAASVRSRRQAERNIDRVRAAYAQDSSFCGAMAVAARQPPFTGELSAHQGEIQAFSQAFRH
ncbi:hypothetical protein ABHF91_00420 [Pseudaeromonas sp. ZJS20]|uniref:hypothetical protein n=1 Tax=Pseudaeromonas aegiceratis TaxID=3153928 RepID=UPI00390C65BC